MEIHYYLTINQVAYVLQIPYPNRNLVNDQDNILTENNMQGMDPVINSLSGSFSQENNQGYTMEKLKWFEDDYIYHEMILNIMADPLFDIFQH